MTDENPGAAVTDAPCAVCGWRETTAAFVVRDTFASYVRRWKRCPWTDHTLRAMGVCIWCYDRIGMPAAVSGESP